MEIFHNFSNREDYLNVSLLPDDADFFRFQSKINKSAKDVPSHGVIKNYINKNGEDYRFETKQNPLKELKDRNKDNITVGRN